ncbi:2,4-dichlorophenol 6-monooxygenase [Massilia sp. Root351]|uniref:FAD-dependent monooxygenase n=1 Tax=Massilia sp. Root351 TaxID=1736522 RepID=UPI00070BA13B|nr:FAD-dependent monooxygenase [Massilia sp. Root351]KQV90050.1 2,4-dichlorophenol 6-monooxygenase [Massilia sp. Root351]
MQHTPILVVGGSLVGLSTSLFLSWHGVAHIVIDKHPGSSPHPRAMGFTETTLEHYRAVGIADQIPQVPAGTRLRRVTVDSLAGDWKSEQAWTPGEAPVRPSELSPCTGAAIAQDRLEPILRAAAIKRGADCRTSTELIDFRLEQDGVLAQVRDRISGQQYEIGARYLIAADGAASPIREKLGIPRSGVGHLGVLRSVLFYCPGADAFLQRGAQQFTIEQQGYRAFLTTYGDSRWVLMLDGDEDRTGAELQSAIRRALGADLAFEIITTGRWELAGRVADTYRHGPIFLAGDAAHQLPPTRGGFGANTGIDDAWNLAWKLKRVLAGEAAPGLLDTYDAERRPIGWLRHQQTFSRPDYATRAGAAFTPDPLFGNDALEFGQLVRSAAVAGAGPDLPAAAAPGQWIGQPGTRAPHVWLERAGRRMSSLDLFGKDYVLISASETWLAVAGELGLQPVAAGTGIVFPPAQPFGALFGVPPEGATVVRPDGVIGWRSQGAPDGGSIGELVATLMR